MVNSGGAARRRLSVDDRRQQLTRIGAELIATRSWDDLTMSEIASAAGVSKPLLYHYFSAKTDLYIAAVRSAADELQEATRPDPTLAPRPRLRRALQAHVDWVEANSLGYRALLQGGASAQVEVQAIVESSRAEVVRRIAESMGLSDPPARLRIALRGWVGFLEGTCLEWLARQEIPKVQLVDLLVASLPATIRLADDAPGRLLDRGAGVRRR